VSYSFPVLKKAEQIAAKDEVYSTAHGAAASLSDSKEENELSQISDDEVYTKASRSRRRESESYDLAGKKGIFTG